MKALAIIHIYAKATPGVTLVDALKEGVELASREWKTVLVSHNDKNYRIDPQYLLDQIISTEEE